MVENRWSVARTILVAGLVLQFVLTVLQILQSYSVTVWVERIANGEAEAIYGSLALLLLLSLIVPAARGRLWALAASVLLQLILTYEMVPWLVRKFTVLEAFTQWILNLSFCVVGATSVVYGTIAILEVLGRKPPVWWRGAGTAKWQPVMALAIVSAFVGTVVAGAGIAQRPVVTGTLPGAADAVVMLSLDRMAFSPTRLELPAGKRVGLLLVNRATDDHSFDVAEQNVHVTVPPGQTGMALVEVPASGVLPFYCGLPGHTEAGMTGMIVGR